MTCDCSPGLSQLQHSWCNIQVVKGYKVTLNTSDVYLLAPVAYRDRKKESTSEEWGFCTWGGQKQDTSVKCWKEKRNRSTTPLPISKGQKAEEASANQEWMDAAGGKKLLLNFVRAMGLPKSFLGNVALMTFNFWQLASNSLDALWLTVIFQTADVILVTVALLQCLLCTLLGPHSAPSTTPESPLQSCSFLPHFHSPGTLAGEDSGRAPGQPTEKAGQTLHCSC